MKEKKRHGLALLALLMVWVAVLTSVSSGYGQKSEDEGTAGLKAAALLSQLSPEERVGQLFLVTMDGSEILPNSPIVELISDYHIGGVALKRSNNNFTNEENSLIKTQELINQLQAIEGDSSSQFGNAGNFNSIANFMPLFIGIAQSGDLYPSDQYFSGLTPMPSQMAIGASWDLSLAEEAGRVVASELSALGFNLIFNPSLDVLETPYVEGRGDLGVSAFGGDPYWVGEMGKAYIRGLHKGSKGQMAVVAKNFPGRGSSDRPPGEDVATVRKSLEQLKMIELAPFFEATNVADDDMLATVDGLLLSHIRYQGFQGNIRATTKPVSFDQMAVDLLMSLPEFKAWRESNGILVSDDLGSSAIKKFFNPRSEPYDARLIALNAFLAGNDLLYMDQLLSSGDVDRFETYKNTINFFVQKYHEDQAFAERVDDSVLRLLSLKFKLYPQFSIEAVTKDAQQMAGLGMNGETAFKITSKAATLISPRKDLLDTILPNEPERNDRIVIFTDVLTAKQCENCQADEIISVNDFQEAIMKLYGPVGSGQIREQNVVSYSFYELADFISNPFNRPEIETNLTRSDWVIFISHDQSTERPASNALHTLLAEMPEAIREKTVVLFSFNAPYYYDATEISAFSAYFCLYTKIPCAFEIAARLLFKEMQPEGSPPVSISAIAYHLPTVTSPDPNQIIELSVDRSSLELTEDIKEDELPIFRLGDNLPIKTGVIIDQNGHPVPNGTVVRFMLNQEGENITVQQIEAFTENGIARTSFKLLMPGRHEIRVSAEPATNSQILLIDISEGNEAVISAVTPTPLPEITSGEMVTPTTPKGEGENNTVKIWQSKFWLWLMGSVVAWGGGYLIFNYTPFIHSVKQRLRVALWAVIGGLVIEIWQLLRFSSISKANGAVTFFIALAIILAAECIVGFFAWWVLEKQHKKEKHQ